MKRQAELAEVRAENERLRAEAESLRQVRRAQSVVMLHYAPGWLGCATHFISYGGTLLIVQELIAVRTAQGRSFQAQLFGALAQVHVASENFRQIPVLISSFCYDSVRPKLLHLKPRRL